MYINLFTVNKICSADWFHSFNLILQQQHICMARGGWELFEICMSHLLEMLYHEEIFLKQIFIKHFSMFIFGLKDEME